MAVAKVRQIRRRIKTVQSTKKITRAMELIAASRIVKAQQRVAAARPYAEQITKVIANLTAAGASLDHQLLVTREPVRRVGFVVITADRGLAGGYNSNVIRLAERRAAEEIAAGREVTFVPVGKKGQGYLKYRGHPFDRSYVGMSDTPSFQDAAEVAAHVMELYAAEQVDIVEIISTQFLSSFTQRPSARRLLPLEPPTPPAGAAGADATDTGPQASYEFEPEPEGILDRLLPRYVEARLFAAMLDSAASEHAARQRAMKTATDNAEELIETLTRVANRARQAEITTEIMEIVGGAEALTQAAAAEEK